VNWLISCLGYQVTSKSGCRISGIRISGL